MCCTGTSAARNRACFDNKHTEKVQPASTSQGEIDSASCSRLGPRWSSHQNQRRLHKSRSAWIPIESAMSSHLGQTTDSSTWDVADNREDPATTCSTSSSSRILSPRANELDTAQRTTKAVGKQAKQQVHLTGNVRSVRSSVIPDFVRNFITTSQPRGFPNHKHLEFICMLDCW